MAKYRIKDWDEHFENASSRKLKKLDWVPIPNKMDGSGYTALVDHPHGAAHLGAWIAMVEIASRQKSPRDGSLTQVSSGLYDLCQCLGRISRLPSIVFEEVIPRLVEIGWVEEVFSNQQTSENLPQSADVSADSPTTSADSPTTSAKSGSTGKGITGKGREGKDTHGARWKTDEAFVRFSIDYLGTGAALVDADFAEAYEFCWRSLDFEQKLERVAALNRHAEEYHADPRYVPRPRKFLETEWERRVVKRKPAAADVNEQAMRLLEEKQNGFKKIG